MPTKLIPAKKGAQKRPRVCLFASTPSQLTAFPTPNPTDSMACPRPPLPSPATLLLLLVACVVLQRTHAAFWGDGNNRGGKCRPFMRPLFPRRLRLLLRPLWLSWRNPLQQLFNSRDSHTSSHFNLTLSSSCHSYQALLLLLLLDVATPSSPHAAAPTSLSSLARAQAP